MLLTNRDTFNDLRNLAIYVTAKMPFPEEVVAEKDVSEACMSFLKDVMGRSPNDRPSSSKALDHVWLSDLHELDDERLASSLDSL